MLGKLREEGCVGMVYPSCNSSLRVELKKKNTVFSQYGVIETGFTFLPKILKTLGKI